MSSPSEAVSFDLAWRGLVHQTSDDKVFNLIDSGQAVAYIGFDPTSDSLHLGNLIQLLNLRRLQLAGNTPIVLAGGATGMIGDPSGKSAERVLLSLDEIMENVKKVKIQLEAFLDFSSGFSQARLVNNVDWISKLSILDFLRDIGKHVTVNQMVAKDSVKSRMSERDQGISYTEFSYMLLQATDFLYLSDTMDCNLQLGASDQWGNITVGIDLIRRTRHKQVFGLTSPLLLKEDGTKFGKSEGGAIYLDPSKTSPYDFYQFFLRSHDSMVGQYLKFFTFYGQDEIIDLVKTVESAPEARQAQRELARSITRFVHGDSGLLIAERASQALFSNEIASLSSDAISIALAGAPRYIVSEEQLSGRIPLVDLLAGSGLVKSKSLARTLVSQGGVYVNNIRCDNVEYLIGRDDLLPSGQIMVRRGKKDYVVVEIAPR